MKIVNDIVKGYLNGESLSTYKNQWYFHSSSVPKDQGRNVFTDFESSEENKKKVSLVQEAILEVTKDFKPLNQPIWDALFPNWREVLKNEEIDLILGFPEPYDAMTEYDDKGTCHIIFDLGCWSKYVGQCNIQEVVLNLLTHELCHVLIGKTMAGIDEALQASDYHTVLDALTFHEGFAHLISYNAKEITDIDWQDEKLREVRQQSIQEMQKALVVEDSKEQKDYLYRAQCGNNYYDKYACMCGLLYLAEVWEQGGIPALKECFLQGWHGFAEKCL